MVERTTLQLELFARDIEKTKRFYVDALGFTVTREAEDYVQLVRGTAVIGLGSSAHLPEHHYFQQEELAHKHGVGVEVVLFVEDLDAVFHQVEAAGYSCIEPPRDQSWGMRDFRVADPDGVYVRISSRG